MIIDNNILKTSAVKSMLAITGEDEDGKQLAATIIEQIGMAALNIGARQIVAWPLYAEDSDFIGGLTMTVGNGRWSCEIGLNFLDLYEVRIINKRSGAVGFENTNVDCFELAEVLITGLDSAMYPTE